MTVYVDDIKASITFLAQTIEEAGDLERAEAQTKATVSLAAKTLAERIDGAITQLDGEVVTTLAAAGDFAPTVAATLMQTIDDMEQLSTLLTMKGYVGRVRLMIAQVT